MWSFGERGRWGVDNVVKEENEEGNEEWDREWWFRDDGWEGGWDKEENDRRE